jgi:DNA-binding MarR family transcriptional regulator
MSDNDLETVLPALQNGIPPEFRRNIGYLLSRSARYLREDLAQALAPMQLTVHEYAILRIIEAGDTIAQQAVAERYGVDRSTMVEVVDKLEAKQLLSREKNPQDRRSYNLIITPKGRKTITRARRISAALHKKFLSPLTEEESDKLYESLARLIVARDSQK